jgi:hypothetical protein
VGAHESLRFGLWAAPTLDISQPFESKQVSLSECMSRLKEMREYIAAEISAQLNDLRNKGNDRSSESLKMIMNNAIKNTFMVFEVEV